MCGWCVAGTPGRCSPKTVTLNPSAGWLQPKLQDFLAVAGGDLSGVLAEIGRAHV